MRILKISTLGKSWQDRDEILLHACFQILIDYVEHEHPENIVDWNADKFYKQTWKEIKGLYKWWKETRSRRRNPLDDKKLIKPPIKFINIPGSDFQQLIEPDKKKYAAYFRALKKYGQLEKKWYKEDQQNLHRLIEIRGYLWT